MRLLDRRGVSDPAESAAVEEFCVRFLPAQTALLLLYVNEPAAVIGRHQVPPAEVDLSFLARRRIRLVRRISGGGAVFHDPGNLNFAFVTAYDRKRFLRYERSLAPVIDALREMGVPARFMAPNSVAVEGRKISGNAQFTDMRRMLVHGTLLFCSDLKTMAGALSPDDSVVASRGVASTPWPVANAKPFLREAADMATFRERFVSALADRLGGFEPLRLSGEQQRRIQRLCRRYRSWQWTWGRSPRFSADWVHVFNGEKQSVRLTVEAGTVSRAVLRSDPGRRVPEMIGRAYSDLFGS